MIGETIAHYRITAKLGEGGMGEVYRARDTKLDRDVAIKILPAAFAQDADRMARFRREAQILASLNHPNIAHIYGVEERALVMELVEGETLKGPLALDAALNYSKQITEALEAAHEKGIVHRDLKPANVMITPAGVIKVLDFGLAAVAQDPASGGTDPSNSPTLTMRATQAGMIMGTAAYMSPEQAAGKPVDRRADIWSFGVVLWEMLTGQQLFTGETVSHVLAAVLTQEPDLAILPTRVRYTVDRCLRKDIRKRWQAIGDVRMALEESPLVAAEATVRARSSRLLPWMVAAPAVMCAAVLAFVHFRETPPDQTVLRTTIEPPDKTVFNVTSSLNTSGPAGLSPDGRRLVFSARTADGKNRLWVRSLDSLTAQPLSETEGAIHPFWSPDSRFIGFFADGKLKKIDASGGSAITLCDVPSGRGGTWNRDGVIIFAPAAIGPLHRVSSSGGVSTPLTTVEVVQAENSHRWPWFLPDGRHFLYWAGNTGQGSIRVGSIDSKAEGKVVVEARANPSNAVYAQGHLLYLVDNATLMAQPFDLKHLTTTGEAVPVAENIQSVGAQRRGVFSVSESDLLVYQAGGESLKQFIWFDRRGKQLATLGDPGAFVNLHFSPDRKNVAVSIADRGTGNRDIWLYDVARTLRTRFTFDPAVEQEAIWSPDGNSIVFDSNRKGRSDLYRKASGGGGADELLYADNVSKSPTSWSPDGKFLLYNALGLTPRGDIWVLPLVGERKPFPFAQTAFDEENGQFSPDGHWIAYQSNESQRNEIYVAPFRGTEGSAGGKRQISTAGGSAPRWRQDGKEIFYLGPDNRLMAADVNAKGTTLEVGAVRPLFGPLSLGGGFSQYDVSADAQRFLFAIASEQGATQPLTLVKNWTAALQK